MTRKPAAAAVVIGAIMMFAPATCTGTRSRRATIDALAGVWCAVLYFLWIGAAWHPIIAPHAHPTASHGTYGAERVEPAAFQPQGWAVRAGEIQPPVVRTRERSHPKDAADDEALGGVRATRPIHDADGAQTATAAPGAPTPRYHLFQTLRL